jgi:uncharacterized protein
MARIQDQFSQNPTRRYKGKRLGVSPTALGSGLLGAGLLIAVAYVATYYWAEGLWFGELNFLDEFWLRSRTQLGLGLGLFSLSLAIVFFNLRVANQLQFNQNCLLPNQANLRIGLGLRALLPLLMGIALLLSAQMLYHSYVAFREIYTARLAVPAAFGIDFALDWVLMKQLAQQPVGLVIVLIGAIALLSLPQLILRLSAIALSLCYGIIAAEEWARVLPALDPTPFNQIDPVFGKELSFYIFKLPLWELVNFWISGLLLFMLLTVALLYLLAGNTVSQGRFAGFSTQQQRHLYVLAAGLLVTTSLSHWLKRFALLYSKKGVTYGAGFTALHVDWPVNDALSLISLGLALFLIWRAVSWSGDGSGLLGTRLGTPSGTRLQTPLQTRLQTQSQNRSQTPSGNLAKAEAALNPKRWRSFFWAHPVISAVTLYLIFALLGNTLAPWLVQRVVVQPNELQRETPYIKQTIASTRAAFGLTNIEAKAFKPEGNLTRANLKENNPTLSNIRLWDTRPLLESNRQLQQIRLYYEFAGADVDRYTIKGDNNQSDRRQVLISARELNYQQVPAEAQTWVNEHLTYTHGYGFTMSPVNTAGSDGLPEYFIKDIAHTPSSASIERSIPIGKPRIYFGELTNTYIMTNSRVSELDYPSGSENVYNRYDGQGGINIGPFWKRLLFAKHLRDWKMLLTDDFTADTRLMFRRNIERRVSRIAPFLQLDSDPYLVVADAGERYAPAGLESGENYLYWMIDAYTTSDRYPYSDPGENAFNYIRNSVKIVVDAYNGSVHFYIADESDPLIRTWAQIFPNMFEPLAAMPPSLLSHIRYPPDFSLVQTNQLLTYHMRDPQVFYNREDQWRAPNELYANKEQVVKPYYLIMELPGETEPEFVLLRPFTPAQRNNLVAWIAARSDGKQYGRQLLYQFPKQELVFGPEQIEARINQEPEISQQISLWNSQGSRANQGNLLVIPIEQSLLYVEPLYLEAELNRLPSLARVIVAYQNRIAMAATLDRALQAIFQEKESTPPTVVRELNNPDSPEEIILPSAKSGE